ncbi:hypothetical protein HDU96_007518 [Phlyctochytrium bullatum]|nr:hypothetical protein HDU96_007518 [Phlyctochytrium bullatum]
MFLLEKLRSLLAVPAFSITSRRSVFASFAPAFTATATTPFHRLYSVNSVKPPMSTRVFVGGLAWETTDGSLKAAFEGCGEVTQAMVVLDRETGRSRGFGFVTFSEAEGAARAVEEMNQKELDGRPVRVDIANEKPDRGSGAERSGPRGGGGGYRNRDEPYGRGGRGGGYGDRDGGRGGGYRRDGGSRGDGEGYRKGGYDGDRRGGSRGGFEGGRGPRSGGSKRDYDNE